MNPCTNTHTSTLFSVRQLKGLQKLGDVMMPGGQGFPSFSETGSIAYVDTAMGSAHPDDIRDFGLLLLFFYVAPVPVIHWVVTLADNSERFPPGIAALLRKLNIGIKGVLVSLYYSGKPGLGVSQNPLDTIDFSLSCERSEG